MHSYAFKQWYKCRKVTDTKLHSASQMEDAWFYILELKGSCFALSVCKSALMYYVW